MKSLLRHPSAWIPIAASLTVFVIMIIFIALSGPPVPQADEGTGAHLFQIWLVLEALCIGIFALKWLTERPVQALGVIVLQIAAALLPMSVVFTLNL